MDEVVCYTRHLSPGEERKLSFWEIFLDERWADGSLYCKDAVYAAVGNLNKQLNSKQNYEFLLRAALQFEIKAVGKKPNTGIIEDKEKSDVKEAQRERWESYRTDCYIIGKYWDKIQASEYFASTMQTLLADAASFPNPKDAESLLEKMISHSQEYFAIDDNTRPFLIYKGADTCYNVLNLFMDELVHALYLCRQRVEIFDMDKEDFQSLSRYIGQHFKAVIGIQNSLFSALIQGDAIYFHDLITGPKYNILLDHPEHLRDILIGGPQNYFFLIHDRNYINYINKYYSGTAQCVHFSCAGGFPRQQQENKIYDITFIGTYRDYRECLKEIYEFKRNDRFLASRFIWIMKNNPDYTGEKAFCKTLEYYDIKIEKKEFAELFHRMLICCSCIMYYYREKIIRTLLQAGIKLHLYSETWKCAPFGNHSSLICHPALDAVSSLKVMQQSKISLNVMSWHKDGMTERVLNAMLCKSVVVSDRSTGLEEGFLNGEDLVLFSLDKLEELPKIIKELLEDEEKQKGIAQRGYEKAVKNHLWINRVGQLLEILDKRS